MKGLSSTSGTELLSYLVISSAIFDEIENNLNNKLGVKLNNKLGYKLGSNLGPKLLSVAIWLALKDNPASFKNKGTRLL